MGMPSWRDVLVAVAQAWDDRRDEIRAGGSGIAERLQGGARLRPSSEPLREELLDGAVEALRSQYDAAHGGFGSAPKFPPASALEFLMRRGERDIVTHTLLAMSSGGMYDQIGGGFSRYSVDPYWLVPHFEKMLYDNALLARAYLHGWQLTGEPLFAAGRRGDARLGPARDARAGGRLLLRARRRLRGRRGQVLCLERRRAARGACRRARRRRGDRLVRRHRPGQLRGRQHPGARAGPAGPPRRLARAPLRGALSARLARPRRQAADLLERADDLGARRGGRRARAGRLPRCRRARGGVRARLAARLRGPAAADLQGRPGPSQRLPRGPRLPGRGAAHALRVDLRPALVRGGPRGWRTP